MFTSIGIAALALGMASLLAAAAGKRIAAVIAVVMSVQLVAAATGMIVMPLIPVTFTLTLALAFSAKGRALAAGHSFAALIAAQSFRLPLELIMHHAYRTGLMPVQMSYEGLNFDILTGITAIPVAWLAWKGLAPRWLLIAWNALGSLLLLIIMAIAVASLPVFQAFGSDRINDWILHPPFSWLPGVLVQAALLGHILLWRKLLST